MTKTSLILNTSETQITKLPEISLASESDIIAHLRHSTKFAELAALAELDVFIVKTCEKWGINVSDEEVQKAGDEFRLKLGLLGAADTQNWMQKQCISVEDWAYGIRLRLLAKKLKEYLFGELVDVHYLHNRSDFRRVALSQILVGEKSKSFELINSILEENKSFCALAIEHTQGRQSKINGGFVGIRFVSELFPEIGRAINETNPGEVVGPIQTALGYHIIRVEKWFPSDLNEEVREYLLDSFFQSWFNEKVILNQVEKD